MATKTKKPEIIKTGKSSAGNHAANCANRNGESPPEQPVIIYHQWCKGCGICVAFCPHEVLEFDEVEQKPVVARPEACNQCGMCELRCPDFAITRSRRENGENGNHEEHEEHEGARSKKH